MGLIFLTLVFLALIPVTIVIEIAAQVSHLLYKREQANAIISRNHSLPRNTRRPAN